MPAPGTGDVDKFLKGNGTWGEPTGGYIALYNDDVSSADGLADIDQILDDANMVHGEGRPFFAETIATGLLTQGAITGRNMCGTITFEHYPGGHDMYYIMAAVSETNNDPSTLVYGYFVLYYDGRTWDVLGTLRTLTGTPLSST